jgi:hypothetical protein
MKTEDKIRIVLKLILSNILYIGMILFLIVFIYVSIQARNISKKWTEANNNAIGVIK